DLETAVRHRIRFVTVVYNDSALSLIEVAQANRGYPGCGVRYGPVDFAAASAALGAWSRRATTLEQLGEAARQARLHDGPAVIEVPVDPAEYHAHAAPPLYSTFSTFSTFSKSSEPSEPVNPAPRQP